MTQCHPESDPTPRGPRGPSVWPPPSFFWGSGWGSSSNCGVMRDSVWSSEKSNKAGYHRESKLKGSSAIGNISCDQRSQHLKMTTTRPSTARALAYLHCQPFLCTWNFDTPKHFGQFWFRLLFIVIRNPLASGIVDPIGSLIGIWFDILRYVLPSNACLLEFVIAIGFEMLACKVYKRGKNRESKFYTKYCFIVRIQCLCLFSGLQNILSNLWTEGKALHFTNWLSATSISAVCSSVSTVLYIYIYIGSKIYLASSLAFGMPSVFLVAPL